MIEFQMDYFGVSFLLAALVGVAWVGLCMVIVPLRARLGLRYAGAIALSWLPAVTDPGGLTIYNAAATLLFDALVCFAVIWLRQTDDRIIEHDHERHSAPAH